jgi:hypothetical protein
MQSVAVIAEGLADYLVRGSPPRPGMVQKGVQEGRDRSLPTRPYSKSAKSEKALIGSRT